MKRFIVSAIAVLFCLSLASAFTPPDGKSIGASASLNKVWIAKSIVDMRGGQLCGTMIGQNLWYKNAMLDGDYYVIKSNYQLVAGQQIKICFDVCGNNFIPDCLQGLYAFPYPVKDNGIGGSNLLVTISQ